MVHTFAFELLRLFSRPEKHHEVPNFCHHYHDDPPARLEPPHHLHTTYHLPFSRLFPALMLRHHPSEHTGSQTRRCLLY